MNPRATPEIPGGRRCAGAATDDDANDFACCCVPKLSIETGLEVLRGGFLLSGRGVCGDGRPATAPPDPGWHVALAVAAVVWTLKEPEAL